MVSKTDTNWFAATCIVVAIVAASIEPIVVKLGLENQLSSFHLFVVKSIIGGMLIFPLTRTFQWVGFRGFLKMCLFAVLLLSTSALSILSLEKLSAVLAITVITTTPAFVAIVNQALGRDQLNWKFWLGFFLSLAGVCLGLEWHNLHMSLPGFAFIFGAVLTSTAYRVSMEGATKVYSPALISTYIFLINGLIAACIILPLVGEPIPAGAWQFGTWMGLTAACANVAFVFAIKLLGSTRISVINVLQRPAIIIAAALILREPVTLLQATGVVFVLVGVQLAQSAARKVVAASTETPNAVANKS